MQFAELVHIPVEAMALVGVLTAAAFFANSVEFALLYRLMGAQIGIAEHWLLYSVGQAGNYAPGELGTVHRIRYLKKVHSVTHADSAVVYGANLLISVFATGLVGLLGCIGFAFRTATWSPPLVTVLAALLLISGLLGRWRGPVPSQSGAIGSAMTRMLVGWKQVRSNQRVVLVVLGLEVSRNVLAAWRYLIVFSWFGVVEPFFFFLIIAPIASLATFVAITPAGLGIREAWIAAVVIALGHSFDIGLLGSSADRAISLAVVLILAVPGTLYTARVMSRLTQTSPSSSGESGKG